jgi:uncharacterized membrane protein YeiH
MTILATHNLLIPLLDHMGSTLSQNVPVPRDPTQVLPYLRYFDVTATFLWAISGALIGVRRNYDVIGVLILAFITAAGGSLLRDGIFLQQGPPVLVTDWRYPAAIAAGFLPVALFGPRLRRIIPLVDVVDAAGLGMYAVVGSTKSLAAGLTLFGVVLVGVLNAAGGAFLRDIVVREEPFIMKPGQYYALSALIGCIFFLVLLFFRVPDAITALLTIGLVFAIRMLSIRFGWRTRPLRGLFPDSSSRKD